MTDLEYRPGKLMKVEPINATMKEVVESARCGEQQVVILEPGDGTRYHLLLLPMRGTDLVSPHLQSFGIQEEDAERYLFVSYLHGDDCPGTWVPFGPGRKIGTHDVVWLSDNDWSQRFLAWWLTNLCEAL